MRRRLVALLAVSALLVAACGNSESDSASDEPAEDPVDESTDDSVDDPGDEPLDDPADDPADESAGDFSEFVAFEETGVTATEIRVASITSKTNPIGGRYADLNQGIELYFDEINGNNGIWGRQLVLVNERDDMLGNNLTEAEGLVSQDNAYAAFIAVLLFTGSQVLADEGIPTFGWNIQEEWTGPESFFPNAGSLCSRCPGRIVPWVARELAATKVAVLGYGNSEQSKVCAETTRDSFDAFDVGADVVFYDDSLSFGQLDFSAQVSRMKDEGVEFVMTCMDLNGVQGLATEMVVQGVEATFYHPNMYDKEFVAANADLFDGDYVAPGFTAFEHEPRIEAVDEFLAAIGDDPYSELTVQGWIAARQFVDALKAAGPEFPREALVATWNAQPEPYTAGGWLPPIDWSVQHNDPFENPETQSPLSCSNLVQIQGGEFVSVFTEGGEEQWVCFDATTDTLGEPELLSFAG